ncbi:neutral cholesterol ester hydrolase 1a isoform X1 [Xyrauchen texanus]|uniref:neutral cholesterol ester hydrolase 1a isoform X1 n=2 Tax=Xyrauchen texanus TaxID=154827 RepID=UPI0022418AFB|nr:neutral cholesterol ester hydrolase 1a isoform X1 [Xyrauchen texanus]XP_051990684.1 neutral cholesterol ester hydrolase 1a isoform X1 [Xyrauchen texanus]XP_051990685.1 neutral cholesterol ester hydrolase 1a isoform X1 [Xyrauchen texanus]XP_051990686.1 neutral cholesterol ester hydrolase 1a isoform X1 [Xyrauchen texanus]
MMKLLCGFTLLLAIVVAYYIYIPLPRTISEPWKLMVLDATFRGVVWMGDVSHSLGLSHSVRVINFAITSFESLVPVTNKEIQVEDTLFDGVHVRVYHPPGKEGKLRRAVVFIHGGGWALCAPKLGSYDCLCRQMADDLDAVVVTVDYRMAPDVHFPVQYEDCVQATKHFLRPEVLAQYFVDTERIAVCGDSAGGNLAAAVAQQIGIDDSTSVKFKLQVLIYPVLQALDFNTASYQQNQNVPILYRTLMARFWLEYLGANPELIHSILINNHTAQDERHLSLNLSKLDWTTLLPKRMIKHYKPVFPVTGSPSIFKEVPALLDARAAPLLANEEVLHMAPRAYILTGEHDVLRDDGIMYARRLELAGVSVTNDHYEDGFHGCVSFAFWPLKFSVGIRAVKNYIAWLDDNL